MFRRDRLNTDADEDAANPHVAASINISKVLPKVEMVVKLFKTIFFFIIILQ